MTREQLADCSGGRSQVARQKHQMRSSFLGNEADRIHSCLCFWHLLAFVGRGAKERCKDGSSSALSETCPERVVPMLHGSASVKYSRNLPIRSLDMKWMAVDREYCSVFGSHWLGTYWDPIRAADRDTKASC